MKNNIAKLILVFGIVLVSIAPRNAFSQTTDTTVYIFELNDGGEIIGSILSEDEREYRVSTRDRGIILLPKYSVKSKTLVTADNKIGEELVASNPHPSRYFYAPSAIPLQKGAGYIQTYYFGAAQIQYGFSDNFSAGFGTTWIGVPLWINLKASGKVSTNVYLGASAQIANFSYVDPQMFGAVGLGTITLGTPERNISISAGAGAFANVGESDATPLINIAGMYRLSKKASFLGEFMLIPDAELAVGGPALRLYMPKVCWDFMLMTVIRPAADLPVIPFPAISAAWKL